VTGLLVASLAMETAAAVTAVLLAWRRPDHRPAAGALVLLAAANLARVPLNAALSPHPVEPWQGVARVLVYLDSAAVLGAIAVTPSLALAVSVSPERRRLAVALIAVAWLLASLVLVALYPSPAVRGAGLQRVYLAADLIGLAVATVALVAWARRGLAARRSPRSAPMVAIGLVALDLGILLVPHSPWRDGTWVSPFGRFEIIQIGIVVFFAAFAAAQGIVWRFSSR
jgi:hypothetical protein